MTGLDVPVTGAGYEALENFLESERSPPESMLMTDLDGFLTGIAIGPAVVMPSEWLPVVWGGEEPVFADDDEAQAVLGGIFSRYNEILHQVEEGTFEPLLWADADGKVFAESWAEGFAVAMGLCPNAWEPLLKSKKHGWLLLPILVLCSDEDGESALGFDLEGDDEIMGQVQAMIPAAVAGIADFWRERRPRGEGIVTEVLPAGARLAPKPGRNALCPCGSGKKFKKCCGSPHSGPA